MRSSGPGPQTLPLRILPSVQDQWGQAEGQVDQEKAQGEGTEVGELDAGIVAEVKATADPTEDDIPKTEAQPEHRGFVPAVEAIDGKGAASRQAVSPASHAVRRFNGILQAPGHHDGKDGDPVLHPLEDAAVGYVPPDALLGGADRPELGIEFGNEAQRHAQDQAQGGDDPSEKIDELVRGHDLVVAGKPLYHGS